MSEGNPFRGYWLSEATRCRAESARNAFNIDYEQWSVLGREKAIVETFLRVGKKMDKELLESTIRLLSKYAGEEWAVAKKSDSVTNTLFWEGYSQALLDIQSRLDSTQTDIPKV